MPSLNDALHDLVKKSQLTGVVSEMLADAARKAEAESAAGTQIGPQPDLKDGEEGYRE